MQDIAQLRREVEEARRICEGRGRESDGSRRSVWAAWRPWRDAIEALAAAEGGRADA